MGSKHNPLECIIPPYMLSNVAENGTPEQKAQAVQSMQISAQIRDQRQEAPATVSGPEKAAAGVRQQKVYTAENRTTLPGRLVRSEGDPPTGDAAVDEAYDGAAVTYDLFNQIYGRNSIDGAGMGIDSTVHYGRNYENAFWNGFQMVYGDGDEALPPADQLFNRFTIAIDIIGHELAHGVTQYTGNLDYQSQPGALNESFSDVFGSLVKQMSKAQEAKQADWIIGEGLFTANVNGVGIRSMKEPGTAYNDPVLGKDPQPGHIRDYVNTLEDNGGVHINSGIPNRAFYLIAFELGGFAWEKAGRIWYVTLRDKVQHDSKFQAVADMTYATAAELYGANSLEQQAVQRGWSGVGILVGSEPPAENTGCLPRLLKIFGG